MNLTLFTAFAAVKRSTAPIRWNRGAFVMAIAGTLFQGGMAQAQDTLYHVAHITQLTAATATALPWAETAGQDFTLSTIGDVDGNGIPDLALGYPHMDGGKGRIGIAFFGQNKAIAGFQWIGEGIGGMATALDSADHFGEQLTGIGDLNNDGVPDIAVLAPGSDLAGTDKGAIHILFLNAQGEVDTTAIIAAGINGFDGPGVGGDHIRSLNTGQDLNGDGNVDLLIGMPFCDLGGSAKGAMAGLFLASNGTVLFERTYSALSAWPGGGPLTADSTRFGWSCSGLGDADGDGIPDVAIGVEGLGQVINLYLNDNGTIKAWKTQGQTEIATQTLTAEFGRALSMSPDLDKDETNELLVADESHETKGVACGAVFYWDALPDTVIKPMILTNGYATDGSLLDLPAGSRLGRSVAVLGDLDEDGLTEIAIAALGNGLDQQPVITIVSIHHAPVKLHLTIVDETPDSLGSVSLRVTGGLPPYTVQWSKELFDADQFNSSKSSVDTVGLWALGLTPPYQTDLTPADLLAMVEPRLVDVKAGQYWVGVEDSLHAKAETEFAVGLELLTLVEVGAATSEDNKEVSKEAGDGWTNMQLQTKNLLPKKEDGWVRFTVPIRGKTLAVGLKDTETADTPGYEHLEFALYFSDTTVRAWNGDALVGSAITYKTGDVFEIARVDTSYVFSINDKTKLKVNGIMPSKALVINVAIYHNSGTVADITTNFKSSFGISPTVAHVGPLDPGTGGISLDLPSGLGPYSYTWSEPGVSGGTLADADAGEYAVTVASAHFDHTASRIYRIGHELVWQDLSLYSKVIGLGTSVMPTDIPVPSWSKYLLSKNLIRTGSGHHVTYRPYPIEDEDQGSIVGLRSVVDGRVWAGWWVYGFGRSHIAQTVSRTGGMTRVLVGPEDELEIVLHTYTIHFLKNGEIVHQVPRATEGDSHLMVALHSMGSSVRDLRTSIPVPLMLNTAMLTPDVAMECETPDGVRTIGSTGSLLPIELGAALPIEGYEVHVPGAPAGSEFLAFSLNNGSATDLQLVRADSTVILDSSLFEFRGLDELILYDEPEVYVKDPSPRVIPQLEKQTRMSPNGDDQYDVLTFTGLDPSVAFELIVRDRTSTIVYQSSDPTGSWNGQFMNTGALAARGTYSYALTQGEDTITGQFMVDY